MPISGYFSNRIIRRLLVLILIIAAAGPITMFIIYRRGAAPALKEETEIIKGDADMVFKNVEQTAIRNGINEWRLNATAAYLIESQKKMVLEKPKVEFFLENGNNVFLTAHKGVLNIESKDIQVEGNVIVRQENYTLKTQKLKYVHAKKRLFTKNSVQITGNRFDLTAGSMNIELNRNQGFFNDGVTGVFNDMHSF